MPRPRPEAKAADKRRSRRIDPYVSPCRIRSGRRRLSGYLTNLSSRGARVYCESGIPPRKGQNVTVEVRLRPRSPLAALKGEVKWVKPTAGPGRLPAFGLTFKGLKPEEQLALEWVLSEFRRHAALIA